MVANTSAAVASLYYIDFESHLSRAAGGRLCKLLPSDINPLFTAFSRLMKDKPRRGDFKVTQKIAEQRRRSIVPSDRFAPWCANNNGSVGAEARPPCQSLIWQSRLCACGPPVSTGWAKNWTFSINQSIMSFCSDPSDKIVSGSTKGREII